jgi:bacteriorhodopsin
MSALVEKTTKASVFVQIVTGAVSALGLVVILPPEHKILTNLLQLEIFVQAIELMFYMWFLLSFQVENLAVKRYFDWMISTPIMLFTMAAYFTYQAREETKDETKNKEELTLSDVYTLNQPSLWTIWISNFFMLLFGFLGETGILGTIPAFTLGTGALLVSFYTLYQNFARFSYYGQILFSLMFVLWSGYGIGFLLPTISKNIVYNGLDILAKNFFGLFLFFQIKRKFMG